MNTTWVKLFAWLTQPDIEGGKVQRPQDHGGRTNMGVTQTVYDAFRFRHHMPKRDVWQMDRMECSTLYSELFWTPVMGDALPWPLDAVLFDSAVQHGQAASVNFLREAMGLELNDHRMTQDLINRIGTHCNAAKITIGAFTSQVMEKRIAFYKADLAARPDQEIFQVGWSRRISSLCGFCGIPDVGEQI